MGSRLIVLKLATTTFSFTSDSSMESFRFWDKEDYEYEIVSILSIAHAWTSVILAGNRHSTTSFSENVLVAGTSYQM